MSNKVIKLCETIIVGAVLLGLVPFVSYAYSPYVSTGSATNITANSATLNGSVNANNLPTSIWFEYGTNGNLINSSSISAYRININYGNSGNIMATITGLYPNTTYYFRAVAQNTDGRNYGNIYFFTTSSSYYPYNIDNNFINDTNSLSLNAITEPASYVGNTSAELNSLIHNEAGNFSNAWFEWGTTANLGNKTAITPIGVLPYVKHVNKMTGLSPGTTYYFRAVVENSLWRNIGSILSFTTNNNEKQNTSTLVMNSIDTTTKVGTKKETTPIIETGQKQSSLEANVADSNSFFPVSIIGWLVLIILMLILILLSKKLYYKLSEKNKKHAQEHM